MEYPPLPGAPSAITPKTSGTATAATTSKKSPSPASAKAKDSVIKRPKSSTAPPPTAAPLPAPAPTPTPAPAPAPVQTPVEEDRPAVIIVGGKSEALDFSRPFLGGISFGVDMDTILTGSGCDKTVYSCPDPDAPDSSPTPTQTPTPTRSPTPGVGSAQGLAKAHGQGQVQLQSAVEFASRYRQIGDASADYTYNVESVRNFMRQGWYSSVMNLLHKKLKK